MESGSISGTITDTSGVSLPGILVTAAGELGPRDSITNTEGRYRVQQLQPGAYNLKAELEGFKTEIIPDLNVRAGHDTVRDMTMELGTVV